jgi:hypothetical protein
LHKVVILAKISFEYWMDLQEQPFRRLSYF